MRGRFFTGSAAVVGVLLVLTGCGALGGGHRSSGGPAPDPAHVIDGMRADVRAAVQAAMPKRTLAEPTYNRQNCASSKWRDTSGSSKIVRSETVGIDGDETDTRPVDEIIGVMVTTLQGRGWKVVHPDKYGAGDPTRDLAKPGVAGYVRLAGSRVNLGRDKAFPTVNGTMFTDCLPNPGAGK